METLTNKQQRTITNWVDGIKERYKYKGKIETTVDVLANGEAYVFVTVNGVDVFDSTIMFSFSVGKRGGVYQRQKYSRRTVKSIFSLRKIS